MLACTVFVGDFLLLKSAINAVWSLGDTGMISDLWIRVSHPYGSRIKFLHWRANSQQ